LSVTLRKATLRDLEDLYQIELECFGDDAFSKSLLGYFLRSPEFVTLVAVYDGEPVGFVTGSFERLGGRNTGHIYSIDVKTEHRRRGIGSALINSIECVLTEKGAETCHLEVRSDNVAAIKLYMKHDYKSIGTLRDYYGFGGDGIRLEKTLRTSH